VIYAVAKFKGLKLDLISFKINKMFVNWQLQNDQILSGSGFAFCCFFSFKLHHLEVISSVFAEI